MNLKLDIAPSLELRPRSPQVDEIPLSHAQQSLWFMAQLVPDHPFYNLPSALSLRGPLDLTALCRTFATLVERHEALRTVFPMCAGQPVQQVRPVYTPEVSLIKVSGDALEERRARARQLASEEGMRPFDLGNGPLLRVVVYQVAHDEHLLVFTMHHIVSDGWSIAVMSREIPLLYDGFRRGIEPKLPSLTIQYGDYALWQRECLSSGKLDDSLAYWRQRLAGIEELKLPTDRPRPAIQSHRGAVQYIEIPGPLRDRLEALAHDEQVTLFMVLLTAFHVLLSRHSGQSETIVGTPMANRERHEIEGLIGFFANSMVLPCNLRKNPSFRTALARVREETLAAYQHREVPFELLVEQLKIPRDPGKNPLFQVMFALQKSSVAEIAFPGLDVEPLNLENHTTHFDMEWHLWNRESSLGGYISYNVDLYEPATILRLASHFVTLLDAVVSGPEQRVEHIALTSKPERDWLRQRSLPVHSDSQSALDHGPVEALIAAVERDETQILLEVADNPPRHWTATHWHALVVQARAYWAEQVTAGECVLFPVLATPRALTAALAAWTLKLALVPVAPNTSAARLRTIAEERGARAILDPGGLDDVQLPEGLVRLSLPAGEAPDSGVTEALRPPPPNATTLWLHLGGRWARLSYASFAKRCAGLADAYALRGGERAAWLGFVTAAALIESMVPLCAGATLVLPPASADAAGQASALLNSSLTQWVLTPDRASQLLKDPISSAAAGNIKRSVCAGGLPTIELLTDFEAKTSRPLRFVYAPPEVKLPIGCADPAERNALSLGSTQALPVSIVDEHGLATPIGVIGRLCVQKHECVTFERYHPFSSPLDPEQQLVAIGERGRWSIDSSGEGQLEICMPVDSTLWSGGERVELTRVARQAMAHPAVVEAMVIPRRARHRWAAVAYIGLHRASEEAALSRACSERLDPHEQPGAWLALARLPRTATGDIDRARLMRLPILDRAVADKWQDAIDAQVGVQQARVLIRDMAVPPMLHHISDLVPESLVKAAPVSDIGFEEEQKTKSSEEERSAWDTLPRAYASGGPIELPQKAPRTLTEALIRTAEAFPERGIRCLHGIDEEELLRYPELLLRAKRVLTGLRKAGLRPGDRVILQLNRLADHFSCFWGCVLAGVVPVAVAVPSTYRSKSSVVNKLYNTWKLLRGPWILHSESLGEGLAGVPELFDEVAPFPYRTLRAEALLAQPPAGDHHLPEPDDVVFYQLTSGSTGIPKCIQETHSGIIHHIHGSKLFNGYDPDDISLNWLPMDHVVPILTCHLKDTYLGIRQIHVHTSVVLADPLSWLDLIDKHRVTHTWSPNFGFKLINDKLAEAPHRAWDLSCLKFAMNAGEQVTLSVVSEWLGRLTPHGVKPQVMQPSFGMAEVCTCMTYANDFSPQTGARWVEKASLGGLLRETEPGKDAINFIDLGPVMPGVEIRITDAQNRVLPEGVIGRFQIRGAVTTPGYLYNDEANRDAFVGDGWFNSGDLGFIKDRRLSLTGREKEIIIIRGANFYCYEIEDVVNGIDGVEPTFSAAIAVQDPATGSETLAVFFVPKHPSAELDGHLIQRVRETVARNLGISPGFVIPLHREAFPKTTSGKIQRTRLKKALASGVYDEQIKRIDLLLGNANTIPAWFRRKVWRPVSLPGGAASPAGDTMTLLLSHGGALCDEITYRLVGAYTLVEPGRAFARLGERSYQIDPAVPAQYDQLLASLRSVEALQILHLWHHIDLPNATESSHEHELTVGTEALLLLVQALQRSGALANQRIKLLSVACHSQAVEPKDCPRPARAAVQALLQTVAEELPAIDTRHIDVEPGAPPHTAERIVAELYAPVEHRLVAYRGERRLLPALAPVVPGKAAGSPLQRNGFYVITGGLGGVGCHLARYLLQSFGTKLLLIGRTPLAEAADKAHLLRELSVLGEVHYAVADVADRDTLARIVRHQSEHWGRPDGAFHLAGTFRTAQLCSVTPEALREELRAKVDGLRALRSVLPHPCQLVVFGSVNALFGGVTAGVYAVANRFVETFVEAERAAGMTTSHCLGWSMWDETGMSRGYLMKEASRAQGFSLITPAKGLLSMIAALAADATVCYIGLDAGKPRVRHLSTDEALTFRELAGWYSPAQHVSPAHLNALLITDQFGTPVPCTATALDRLATRQDGAIDDRALLLHSTPGQNTAVVEARTSTERVIASIWGELLQRDEIDVNASFFELGGQSILLVQVHHRLMQVTGRALTVVDLLRYPTVATLAQFLDQTQKQAPSYEAAAARARKQKRAARRRRRRYA